MKFSTSYRVAAGLIYLSIGSLVGLLLAPLLLLSLVLRLASWLPLVAVPKAVLLCVRAGSAVGRG
ncbi:sensor histidine kinase, partial [Streptomyces sp. McG2]|nr:sensor histidine kinase [Streptomyces sp. McG2]